MKKNYNISFHCSQDLSELIQEVIVKLNKESSQEILKSDFLRIAVNRICQEIKSGSLAVSELLYRNRK